jgi:hypothetical protein
VAFTLRFFVIVTLQPPVPEQSPPQPAKSQPLSADFESVTVDSTPNVAEQWLGQSIPPGLLDTWPFPETLTVSVKPFSCNGPAEAGAPIANNAMPVAHVSARIAALIGPILRATRP